MSDSEFYESTVTETSRHSAYGLFGDFIARTQHFKFHDDAVVFQARIEDRRTGNTVLLFDGNTRALTMPVIADCFNDLRKAIDWLEQQVIDQWPLGREQ